MEIPGIEIAELLECNNIQRLIIEAQKNELDIQGCIFKGCYEAHIDTSDF